MISMALATGMRQAELLSLNCGDVFKDNGDPRGRFTLRVFKQCNDNHAPQEIIIPETLRRKLKKFRNWKKRNDQRIDNDAPLLMSRNHNRLSAPRARAAWKQWQQRAGLEREFSFHELRHTAITQLYRQTKDLRMAQRFARHVSPITTSIYAHVCDEDLSKAVQGMIC
jgi:site-specific recombinase XerD